jgi:hypothetical protein
MNSPTVDGINTWMVSKLVASTGIKWFYQVGRRWCLPVTPVLDVGNKFLILAISSFRFVKTGFDKLTDLVINDHL